MNSMTLYIECMPCLLNQACNLAKKHLNSEDKQHILVTTVLQEMSQIKRESSAPLVARKIHRLIKEYTGNNDPYRDIKNMFNKEMLAMQDNFKNIIKKSENQFLTALKLATAGNIIDFGANSRLEYDEVINIIEQTMNKDFPDKTLNQLENDISNADTLLYLGDNAGEVVLDKLFLQTIKNKYPDIEIFFAVRGQPVINDITKKDAEHVGINKYAHVIENGTDIPGTVLSECSPEFMEIFNRASVIISKGQGNFESLIDERRNVYFVFLCKCHVFEKKLGLKRNDVVLCCQ
ncbi:MAG: ARMT1-like domain-containing protein [Clostridiales bacterium]|nr:ARMT1-like domain-containing protein [Clostridiales bacterium]MCF8022633.1 ARMT1-like domain-containing protein [Clostridiales bacterium]